MSWSESEKPWKIDLLQISRSQFQYQSNKAEAVSYSFRFLLTNNILAHPKNQNFSKMQGHCRAPQRENALAPLPMRLSTFPPPDMASSSKIC
jgi:hypothetical protein